jgi:hypothetical protein
MADWVQWYQLQWGMRLSAGGDVIRISSVTAGPAGSISIGLRVVNPVTWLKSIRLNNQADFPPVFADAARPGPNFLTFPVIPELLQDANTYLVFEKAAFLGVHTGYYQLGDVMRCTDKTVTFDWLYDFGGALPPTVPPPAPPVPWP